MKSPAPASAQRLLLALILGLVTLLSVVYFLNQLSYGTTQDPWGYLFASRQYVHAAPLWNDPVVAAMRDLEQAGHPFPVLRLFNGDYQWYYHGTSGFALPWTYAWVDVIADRLFGLGAAFWVPLAGALAIWGCLALIGHTTREPLLGVFLLVAAARWLPLDPNRESMAFLFLPHREACVLALLFAATALLLSRWRGRHIAAGVCMALAFAVREQALVAAPFGGLAAALGTRADWESPNRWRHAVRRGLLWAAGFAVGLLPWIAQRWACDAAAPHFWAGTAGVDSVAGALAAAEKARYAPGLTWPPALLAFYVNLLHREFGVTGWLCMGVGIVALVRRGWWPLVVASLGMGGALLVLHGSWHETSYRYALSIMMLLYPLVGAGLWALCTTGIRLGERLLPAALHTALALSVAGGLGVALMARPMATWLAGPATGRIARSEALQFRADVARTAEGRHAVILVNLERHCMLFCSATYWLDGYVFSPRSIDEAATPVINRLLAQNIPVLLATDTDTPATGRDAVAAWVARTWPLVPRGTTRFGQRVTLWQLASTAAQSPPTTSSSR